MASLKRLRRDWQHTLILLRALPSAPRRELLWRMVCFSRALPGEFDKPLPDMMAHLTPPAATQSPLAWETIRQLADAVAVWHLRSPLGLCLRRSLLRYHFLRETDLPVQITFGARLKGEAEGGGLGGHAWLLLDGQPYCENPADYKGFVRLYTYPEGCDSP